MDWIQRNKIKIAIMLLLCITGYILAGAIININPNDIFANPLAIPIAMEVGKQISKRALQALAGTAVKEILGLEIVDLEQQQRDALDAEITQMILNWEPPTEIVPVSVADINGSKVYYNSNGDVITSTINYKAFADTLLPFIYQIINYFKDLTKPDSNIYENTPTTVIVEDLLTNTNVERTTKYNYITSTHYNDWFCAFEINSPDLYFYYYDTKYLEHHFTKTLDVGVSSGNYKSKDVWRLYLTNPKGLERYRIDKYGSLTDQTTNTINVFIPTVPFESTGMEWDRYAKKKQLQIYEDILPYLDTVTIVDKTFIDNLANKITTERVQALDLQNSSVALDVAYPIPIPKTIDGLDLEIKDIGLTLPDGTVWDGEVDWGIPDTKVLKDAEGKIVVVYDYGDVYVNVTDMSKVIADNPAAEGTEFVPPSASGDSLFNVVTKKFPFSLPWDFYNVIAVFNAEPKIPKWQVDTTIFGQPFRFQIDLSFAEPWMPFFRGITILGYILALLFGTRKFFGGAS